jgi:hypothetical protein
MCESYKHAGPDCVKSVQSAKGRLCTLAFVMAAPCVLRGVQTKSACVMSLILFFKGLRHASVLQCIRNTAQNLISTHSTIV